MDKQNTMLGPIKDLFEQHKFKLSNFVEAACLGKLVKKANSNFCRLDM